MLSKRVLCLAVLAVALAAPSALFAVAGAEDPVVTRSELSGIGFNPDGYPVVSEPVTIKLTALQRVADAGMYETSPLLQELEEETGVTIEWDLMKSQEINQKKALIFASGDLPDALFAILKNVDFFTYGPQGYLISLEGLIEEYADNLKALRDGPVPDLFKGCTSTEGHIYSIPYGMDNGSRAFGVPFINKMWLDKLGHPIPKTTAELKDSLKAMVTGDPNGNGEADEVGILFQGKGYHTRGINILIGMFGRSDTSLHYLFEGDKVVFVADKPEFKDAMVYLHELNAEGLIDVESFTYGKNPYRAKLKEGKAGIFFEAGIAYTNYPEDLVKNAYVPMALPAAPGRSPKMPRRSYIPGSNGLQITADCALPEVVIRWADYLYDEERSIYYRYGRSVKALGDGMFEWVGIPEDQDTGTWIWAPETAIPHLVTFESWVRRAGIQDKDSEKIAISELLADQLTEKPAFLDIIFSTEEQEELGMYQEDIRSYVDQKIAKWITQGGVEEEWDTYLSELKSIGLDKWLAVLQKGYDRFIQ